jgi:hypothetical protein
MPVVTTRVSVPVPLTTWTVLFPFRRVMALLGTIRTLLFCWEIIFTVADSPSLRVTLAVLELVAVANIVAWEAAGGAVKLPDGIPEGIVKLPDGIPDGVVLLADAAGN